MIIFLLLESLIEYGDVDGSYISFDAIDAEVCFLMSPVGQLLNGRLRRVGPCGRGLAWSMISACHCSVQQNADDPGNRLYGRFGNSNPGGRTIDIYEMSH
jgi:hypothetical protein